MATAFQFGEGCALSYLDKATSEQLISSVLDSSIRREKVFRDNWRTLSTRVQFQGESLLLKVPRARNRRRWERFLTLFRGSDAFRSFHHLELMSEMGFAAPEPVLVWQLRRRRRVIDSFLCYRFIEGRPAGPSDAESILRELRALHSLGYIRNDAQLANFLIVGDTAVFIDFRLKKPWFLPQLQKARELDRFLRSCPEARELLCDSERSSIWFWLASRLERASFGVRNLKHRLRDRRKSRDRAGQSQ